MYRRRCACIALLLIPLLGAPAWGGPPFNAYCVFCVACRGRDTPHVSTGRLISHQAAGLNPPAYVERRAEARGWARHDVLPGLKSGVSLMPAPPLFHDERFRGGFFPIPLAPFPWEGGITKVSSVGIALRTSLNTKIHAPKRGGSLAAARADATRVALTTVVVAPGAMSDLTRLTAARDDLYVLDAAAEHVRRYILHGLAHAELFTQVMRWKEGADKLVMGRPIDLYQAGERLLILDDLGSLWSYWGPDYGRLLIPLRLQSNQGTISALALHGDDLLLLDPTKQQVWRYAAGIGGGYDTVPQPLLAHRSALLTDARRLAVTRSGLVIARADGGLAIVPWSHADSISTVPTPLAVTGVWASATSADILVSTAHDVALLSPRGAVLWMLGIGGLGVETIRDIALSPTGHLYVLTAHRILRVEGTQQFSFRWANGHTELDNPGDTVLYFQ